MGSLSFFLLMEKGNDSVWSAVDLSSLILSDLISLVSYRKVFISFDSRVALDELTFSVAKLDVVVELRVALVETIGAKFSCSKLVAFSSTF